jgi:mannose-6-phosphate isomerase-like protein (cupin superfamily)
MIEPIFSKAEVHKKTWGKELWIHNSTKYCGKILEFNENTYFSMHYHLIKEETWFVIEGSFELEYYDLKNAIKHLKQLKEGDVVHIVPGVLHKLRSIGKSKILEVSTQHFEEDSYRIEKSIE